MQNVGAILDRLRRDGLFRVVLIHHPPLTGQGSTTRGLRDAAAFQRVLTSHGAELVLHGHDHRSTLAWLRCATGRAAIVGVPSAALGRRHRHEPLARYHLYRIAENNPSTVLLVARGLAEPGGPVIELEKRELTLRDEGHEN
jgi:3',5'-cyclic AMP phosphodiesterase CpdA